MVDYSLECAQGSFALTGQAAGILASRKLDVWMGRYVLSGSSLPRYLLNNYGTEKENFDAVSEWTVETGSAADNTAVGEYRSGSGSIKMTNSAGVNTKMIKTFPSFSFPSGTRIRLYVYLYAADFANIDRFYVAFAAAGWSNYVQATFISTEQNFHAGWNVLECPLWKWSLYGTGWSTNFTILRIWLINKTGVIGSASIDSLLVGIEGVPAAMITFDDGISTVYSSAFSYMQTKSARGTFFIDTSKPGTAGQVTVSQLQEMDAAGWSIGNHSDAITQLTTYTQEEVQTHIMAAKAALDGWGLTKASKHLAYPSGAWNDTTIAALEAESFLTGRTILQSSFPILEEYGDDLLSYKIYTYPGSTFAAMKIGIDRALSSGFVYVFTTHQLPGDVTVADFQAMIDYIQSLGMPFITVNDLYDAMQEPTSWTNITVQRNLALTQGSYALTGQTVSTLAGRNLALTQGAYTITGQDVGLLYARIFSFAYGSYALTGQDVDLTAVFFRGGTVTAGDTCLYTVTASDMRCT